VNASSSNAQKEDRRQRSTEDRKEKSTEDRTERSTRPAQEQDENLISKGMVLLVDWEGICNGLVHN
jgi:hypothetical protein